MRPQIVLDRISMERAEEIIRLTDGHADILEVGTSLIKDFGLKNSVGRIKSIWKEQIKAGRFEEIRRRAREAASAVPGLRENVVG